MCKLYSYELSRNLDLGKNKCIISIILFLLYCDIVLLINIAEISLEIMIIVGVSINTFYTIYIDTFSCFMHLVVYELCLIIIRNVCDTMV